MPPVGRRQRLHAPRPPRTSVAYAGRPMGATRARHDANGRPGQRPSLLRTPERAGPHLGRAIPVPFAPRRVPRRDPAKPGLVLQLARGARGSRDPRHGHGRGSRRPRVLPRPHHPRSPQQSRRTPRQTATPGASMAPRLRPHRPPAIRPARVAAAPSMEGRGGPRHAPEAAESPARTCTVAAVRYVGPPTTPAPRGSSGPMPRFPGASFMRPADHLATLDESDLNSSLGNS